jgi:hypothetical protein
MSESERHIFEQRAHMRGGAHVVSPLTVSNHGKGPSVATKDKAVNLSNCSPVTASRGVVLSRA